MMKRSELPYFKKHALYLHENEPSERYVDLNKKMLSEFGKEIAEQLEPELKPVDMSVLVNNRIDCKFWDRFGVMYLCHLEKLGKNIDNETVFLSSRAFESKCKPRMNYWFSAKNFDDPQRLVGDLEDAGFSVLPDGWISATTCDRELTSFMIKDELKDGFCWPWELDDD